MTISHWWTHPISTNDYKWESEPFSPKYSRCADSLGRSPSTPYFGERFCSLSPPLAAVATLQKQQTVLRDRLPAVGFSPRRSFPPLLQAAHEVLALINQSWGSQMNTHYQQLVLMTQGVHPFPYRTRKLSPVVPKIVGWRRPVKIGKCQHPIVSILIFF